MRRDDRGVRRALHRLRRDAWRGDRGRHMVRQASHRRVDHRRRLRDRGLDRRRDGGGIGGRWRRGRGGGAAGGRGLLVHLVDARVGGGDRLLRVGVLRRGLRDRFGRHRLGDLVRRRHQHDGQCDTANQRGAERADRGLGHALGGARLPVGRGPVGQRGGFVGNAGSAISGRSRCGANAIHGFPIRAHVAVRGASREVGCGVGSHGSKVRAESGGANRPTSRSPVVPHRQPAHSLIHISSAVAAPGPRTRARVVVMLSCRPRLTRGVAVSLWSALPCLSTLAPR